MATGILCILLGFLAGIIFGLLARSVIENRLSSKDDDDFINSIMNKNRGNSPLKFTDIEVKTKPKAKPAAKDDLGKKYADMFGFVPVQCGCYGRIINVLPEGAVVEKGARVATFESMKMEIYCTAPEAGYIVETLPVGEEIDSGDTVAIIAIDPHKYYSHT